MLEQLQQKYTASFDQKIAVLNQALEQNDVQALTVQIHQLAGSSGSYGFNEISDLCTEIEMLSQQLAQVNPTLIDKTEQLIKLLEKSSSK